MTMTNTTPRIYVASLSDYNAGVLHGVWIDLDCDADSVQEQVQAMLAESPTAKREGIAAEEWAIHDHEGFYGMSVSEHASFEDLCELAEQLEKHGEAWAAYVDNIGTQHATVEGFEEAYQGLHESLEAYAEQYLEDAGYMAELPEWARPYLDVEAYARDLALNGDLWTHETSEGVHVFFNL